MDNAPFFALLRSFAEFTPLQLERAREHIHNHLQHHLLHQALAEQQAVRPDCPHCHATRVIHWGQAHGSSVIAALPVAKHSISYTTPRWPGCTTSTSGPAMPIACARGSR